MVVSLWYNNLIGYLCGIIMVKKYGINNIKNVGRYDKANRYYMLNGHVMDNERYCEDCGIDMGHRYMWHYTTYVEFRLCSPCYIEVVN